MQINQINCPLLCIAFFLRESAEVFGGGATKMIQGEASCMKPLKVWKICCALLCELTRVKDKSVV